MYFCRACTGSGTQKVTFHPSQVIEILGPILDDVVAKQPTLDAIVVDQLDLGETPLRLAGIKVYNTKDDEVIMECPIQWGSLMKVRFDF